MKAKHLFVALTVTLAIGSITYTTINKEYKHLDAAYLDIISKQTDLYIKVTDESTIQDGERLLLVGGGDDDSGFKD